MIFTKLFCVLICVAVISAEVENGTKNLSRALSHNLIECDGDPAQGILFRTTVSAPGNFLHKTERSLVYPVRGVGQEKISCLKVIDNFANGRGGYVDILDGGLGFRYVSLRFTSQLSCPMNFKVEIYGV